MFQALYSDGEAMIKTEFTASRAPVQGEHRGCKQGAKPYGSVDWSEHLEAWTVYNSRHRGQSAERIAERGGFSYWEITELLGREPNTWEPRVKP